MFIRPVRSLFPSIASHFISHTFPISTDEESRPVAGKILSRWRPRKEEQQQAQKQTAGPQPVSLEVRTSSSNESAMNGFQSTDSSRARVEEAHTGKDEAATQHGQMKEQDQETEQLESSSAVS